MTLHGRARRSARAALAAAAIAALGGCGDRMPSGQVVASVAGSDITRRDLAVEAASGRRGAVSPAQMRSTVLADLVDRTLLVARARRDGLDRTPEYLGAIRRERDVVLAGMAAQQIAAAVAPPSAAEARVYGRDHPTLFAGRMLFLVEAADGDPLSRRWIDGAALLPAEARRLAAARVGGVVTVASIAGAEPLTLVARRSAPVPAEAAVRQAATLIRERRVQDRIAASIEAERAAARVRYQPGFGPAAR